MPRLPPQHSAARPLPACPAPCLACRRAPARGAASARRGMRECAGRAAGAARAVPCHAMPAAAAVRARPAAAHALLFARSVPHTVPQAYHNMGRIRLVWSRLWHVVAQHLVSAACHTGAPLPGTLGCVASRTLLAAPLWACRCCRCGRGCWPLLLALPLALALALARRAGAHPLPPTLSGTALSGTARRHHRGHVRRGCAAPAGGQAAGPC